MLSVYHIEKLFRAGHFESLLRGVCPIGMDMSLPLRVRISQHPAAVTALALRRVLELTYGRTDLSMAMVDALLAMQEPSGLHAGPLAGSSEGSFENDPLSTAAAAEAMQRVLSEQGEAGDPDGRIADALDHTWQALEAMQDDDGLFRFADDRSDQDRAMTAAFIAMLIGQSKTGRDRVCLHAIENWFEEHDDSLDTATAEVWRLAMVEQSALKSLPKRSNQMAAIAA